MKIILIILTSFFVACSASGSTTTTSENTVSAQYPSTDKNVLEGLTVSKKTDKLVSQHNNGDYSLLQRLAKTVWYQTEKEEDDGRVEVETEYVFFNDNSWIVERESENGVMERVESDDFRKSTWITDVPVPIKDGSGGVTDPDALIGSTKKTPTRNAMVAMVHELGDDVEYEGYFIQVNDNFEDGKYSKVLYIVEGDTEAEATTLLKNVIENPKLAIFLDTERYILSITPTQIR